MARSKQIRVLNIRYLLLIRKHQVEMLHDRGFPITDPIELALLNFNEMTDITPDVLNQFNALYHNGQVKYSGLLYEKYVTIKEKVQRKRIAVEFIILNDSQVAKTKIPKDMAEAVKNVHMQKLLASTPDDEYKLIIISQITLGQLLLNDNAEKRTVSIETFVFEDLFINPTKHYLVPPHRLLNQTEKEDYLTRNGLKIEQLSKIAVTDPIAKYYGAVEGELMRIERRIPAADGIDLKDVVTRAVTDVSIYLKKETINRGKDLEKTTLQG